MPPITIPDQAPIRVTYVVGGTPDDTFNWPFRLFKAIDLKAYVDGSSTPVPFTISSVIPDANGATVVLDTPIVNATVVLVGDLAVQRTVNFPTSGPFPINTLNEQLNEIFAILQEQESRLDRTLSAEPWSFADFSLLNLPEPDDGLVPAWNGNQGAMQNISTIGTPGPQGDPGLVWLSTYNAGTTYAINDAVFFNGSSYVSLVGSNIGNDPDVSPAQWDILAQQGAAGAGTGDMLVATYDPTSVNGAAVFPSLAQTLTNKTMSAASNTFTGLVQPAITTAFTKQQNFTQATLVDGAAINWDLDDEQTARVVIAGNRVLQNPLNQVAGGTYTLIVVQDPTGSRTLGYDTDYLFPGGTAPVLSTGSNAIDVLTFLSDGTNMFGVAQKSFS